MTDNRLLFGALLGVVGGLVILVYGVYELYLGEVVSDSSVMGWGIVGIILGIGIMVVSVGVWASIEHRTEFGVLMIVLSLVSLVSLGGGNGVGVLLGVIGGACGIAFGEEESESVPPRATAPRRPSRACPNCGKAYAIGLTTCPECGAKL